MSNKPTYKSLDDVLRFLNQEPVIRPISNIHEMDPAQRAELFWKTENNIAVGVSHLWKTVDPFEVKMMLDYLMLEKYVEQKQMGMPPVAFYKITYAGRILIESGGYEVALEKESQLSKTSASLLQLSSYGAIGAAVFAALYLFWDIAKFLIEQRNR